MRVKFTKMEGLGNDYVYIETDKYPIADPSALAIRLSDRRRCIGSDGLVLISGSDKADFRMRIFNPDGSEAQMCGNACRCIGKYVYEKGLTDKRQFTLETLAGIRNISIRTGLDGLVDQITVEMGRFGYDPKVSEVTVGGRRLEGYSINVGNPHFVIFTDARTQKRADFFGPAIEVNGQFPERTNVEFARVIAPDVIKMRVWERGAGITLACGTGACATAAAAVTAGLVGKCCKVEMDGGSLHIQVSPDGNITLIGPAEYAFEGSIEID